MKIIRKYENLNDFENGVNREEERQTQTLRRDPCVEFDI